MNDKPLLDWSRLVLLLLLVIPVVVGFVLIFLGHELGIFLLVPTAAIVFLGFLGSRTNPYRDLGDGN